MASPRSKFPNILAAVAGGWAGSFGALAVSGASARVLVIVLGVGIEVLNLWAIAIIEEMRRSR